MKPEQLHDHHSSTARARGTVRKCWPCSRWLTLFLVFVSCQLFSASHLSAQDTSSDPLDDLVIDMKIVARRLGKAYTDKMTQDAQADIVTRLDTMIEQLEKQCQGLGPGRSGSRPANPAKSSTVMKGPGGSGPLHQARKNGKQWAELPPHERDRIMQSMNEGFPSHYQNILETYFKRLAEEKPAEAPLPATESESQPTKPSANTTPAKEKP